MTVDECRALKVGDDFFQRVINQAVSEYFMNLRDSSNVQELANILSAKCEKAKRSSEAKPVTLVKESEFGKSFKKKNPVWDAEDIVSLLKCGYQYTSEAPPRQQASLDEQFWKRDA